MANEFQSLTVKFGANTIEFDNSTKGINKALAGLKKDIQTLNKSIKFDPGNLDLLNKKMTTLQEQSRVATLKIGQLKQEQAALGKEKIGTAEWQKLQSEIASAKGQVEYFNTEIKKTQFQIDYAPITKLDSELERVNKQLSNVEKGLELDPGNADLEARKIELLGEKSELTQKKIGTLDGIKVDLDVNSDPFIKLESEALESRQALNKVDKELREIKTGAKEVGETDISFKVDLNNLMEASEQVSAIGAGILNVGRQSMDSFSVMDGAMDSWTSKTGAASGEIEDLYHNISSTMAVEGGLGKIGEAAGELNTQFGYTGKELQEVTEYMLKFAQINGTDVTNSSIQAKKAMDLFNLSADELPNVLDAITSTAQTTGVSTNTLFGDLQKHGPTLQNLGLNLEQSTRFLGDMNKAGIDSTKAMSSMTRAQARWAEEGKSTTQGLAETSEAIKNAKSEQEALAYATEIFGVKQAPTMVKAIKDGTISLEDYANTAKDSAGLVGETFKRQKDPIDQLTIAQQQVTNAMADLGGEIAVVLAPALEVIGEVISNIADRFGNLPGPAKVAVVVITGIIGALMAMLPAIIGVITFVQTLSGMAGIKGLSLTFAKLIPAILPLLPVIAGVVAAIAIVIVIIKNWGAIVEWLKGVWQGITGFFTTLWQNITSIFSSAVEGVKSVVTNAFNTISNVVSTIVTGIANIIKTIFTTIGNIIKTIVNTYVTIVTTVFNTIKTTITTVINGIRTIVSTGFNAVKNVIQNVFNTVKDVVSKGWNVIKTFFSRGISGIVSIVSGLWGRISNFFTSIPSKITGAIGDITSIGRDIMNGIIDGIASMGGVLVSKISSLIPGPIKKALGIRSPSRVMRDVVGIPIMQGIAQGMDKGVNFTTEAGQRVAKKIQDELIKARNKYNDGLANDTQALEVSSAGEVGTLASMNQQQLQEYVKTYRNLAAQVSNLGSWKTAGKTIGQKLATALRTEFNRQMRQLGGVVSFVRFTTSSNRPEASSGSGTSSKVSSKKDLGFMGSIKSMLNTDLTIPTLKNAGVTNNSNFTINVNAQGSNANDISRAVERAISRRINR